MSRFSDRLKQIAHDRQLSGAEIARICDLPERTYGNYAGGIREPDYDTLVRICTRLGVTPNDLLLEAPGAQDADPRSSQISRIVAAVNALPDSEVDSVVIQVEALAAHRREKGKTKQSSR